MLYFKGFHSYCSGVSKGDILKIMFMRTSNCKTFEYFENAQSDLLDLLVFQDQNPDIFFYIEIRYCNMVEKCVNV